MSSREVHPPNKLGIIRSFLRHVRRSQPFSSAANNPNSTQESTSTLCETSVLDETTPNEIDDNDLNVKLCENAYKFEETGLLLSDVTLRPSISPFYLPPKRAPRIMNTNVASETDSTKESHATSRNTIKIGKEQELCNASNEDKTWLRSIQTESTGIKFPMQSCTCLANIDGSAEASLLVADLVIPNNENNLPQTVIKTIQGHRIVGEHKVPAPPVALVYFYPDINTQPRIPVVALASGPNVFMYHANTPFQRFSLPCLVPNANEAEVWEILRVAMAACLNTAANDFKKIEVLVDLNIIEFCWENLNEIKRHGIDLTERSLRFLNLKDPKAKQLFISDEALSPLVIQSEISCMTVMYRNSDAADAQGMLVIGNNEKIIYIVSPPGYSIIEKFSVVSPIANIAVHGFYENEFVLGVVGKDRNLTFISRTIVQNIGYLETLAVGIVAIQTEFIIALMNKKIVSYSLIEKKFLSSKIMPSAVLAIEKMSQQMLVGYAVALENKEIFALKFGNFGRDSGCLAMIKSSGELDVRILRRHALLNELTENEVIEDTSKKSNIHLDRNEKTSSISNDIKFGVKVNGIAPSFKVTVTLANIGLIDSFRIYLTFCADPNIYQIEFPAFELGLSKGQKIERETLIHLISQETSGIFVPQKTYPLTNVNANTHNFCGHHVFLSGKLSPAAGESFLKKLIHATAERRLVIESPDDVHEEFIAEENEAFE
ncbi:Bardet-Biedl syndrome 1 protein, partial [Physocladia obscura]